jgi:hypothetical protein
MGSGVHAETDMTTRKTKELVQEGEYLAEVEVELIETEGGWSPYLSQEDASKLDAVRRALRKANISDASKLAGVYRLLPVNAA